MFKAFASILTQKIARNIVQTLIEKTLPEKPAGEKGKKDNKTVEKGGVSSEQQGVMQYFTCQFSY
jgi:hypothetical protein